MNARAFLVRGLLAGVLAGLATFSTAWVVGEPQVDTAIALEEAAAAPTAEHAHEGAETAPHTHDDAGTEVTRATQSTWGLATGTLAVGVALGGIVALVSAATVGRMGRMTPGQSTATVTLVGFVSFALVPFLKYPATPPAVGSGETIGERTALYFAFVLVSVVAAVVATGAAVRLHERIGTYGAVVSGAAGYLAVVVVASLLFGTVNEVGDFPADTLWSFRVASLLTLATMWGVLGIALTGFVTRLHTRETTDSVSRELAPAG
jgi:hypothetical protein